MLRVACLLGLAAVLSFGQGTDYSKVEIKSTKLSNNLYTLEGSGGMIGVVVGNDGVFMVDTQFAPLSDKIIAAIKKVSNAPIKFVVNTHVHPDHTGGNENLAKTGATLLARPQLRERLAHPAPGANGQPGTPAPAGALPVLTYDSTITFHMNGEEIQAIPIRAAHTDGDTLVRFVNNDVIMTGDFYRSLGYPNIDRNNGGSIGGMLAGFDAILKLTNADTKIVPGHGAVVDKNAVAAHKDIMVAVRDKLAALVKDGKTLEEAIAAKLTADFDARVPGAAETSTRFITQMYDEIKAGK